MINLSDKINIDSNSLDEKYCKGREGTWDSVNEWINNQKSNFSEIRKGTTIYVNIEGTPTEMWNPFDAETFIIKSDNQRASAQNKKGYIVLDPFRTISSQLNNTNTIYEIRYEFDLNSANVSIPSGCTIRFSGGSFKNGTVSLNKTKIERVGNYPIFENLVLKNKVGSDVYLSFLNWDNSYSLSNFEKLKNLYNIIYGTQYNIIYDLPELYIEYNSTIFLEPHKVYDFNNIKLYAHSLTLSRYLFTVNQIDYTIDESRLTSTDYNKISDAIQDPFFQYKQGIIFIEDRTPLYNRTTNKIDYVRRDVLLVQNNELCNLPIMDYDDDPDTNAEIIFMPISHGGFKFCNLRYDRTGGVEMTPLLWINYVYKPEIYNITIDSDHPEWKGYAESGTIRLEWVYSPYLHDLSLNNCYGDVVGTDQVNYNINMQGATNVVVERVFANCKWHTWGNQSINGAVCRDCILDQWDSHVYGKDFLFENCTFHLDHLGCPEVGFLKCINCKFINANIGYLADSNVSIFPTQRIFESCVFELQDKPLVRVSPIHDHDTVRQLIKFEKYPTLNIKDCIINISGKRTTWILYEVVEGYTDSTTNEFIRSNGDIIDSDQMADINIENLVLDYKGSGSLRFWLTNSQPFKVNININGLKDIIKEDSSNRIYLSTENIKRGYIHIERSQMEIFKGQDTLKRSDANFYNNFSNFVQSGTSAQRPNNVYMIGTQYFDTTIGKPIYWTGTEWVDCNGNNV